MIEVSNLTKRYGQKVAVDNLSFHVNRGEILGFLGLNGAGKSTTMNILTGYLSASDGVCKIDGHDILDDPLEAKRLVGYLPELPPLYLDMTVREYLDFVYDLKRCKLPKTAHVREVCNTVKLTDHMNRLIKNLSKGYRQRVGLAEALIGSPDVLILDEPTVGLDPKQIIEIRSLVKSLGEKHTVILSSHILPEVQAVCDRIIVIDHGRLVADDTTENLSRHMSTDHRYVVRIDGPEKEVLKTLSSISGMKEVVPLGKKEEGVFEYSVEGSEGTDLRREIFKRLAERNWPLLGLKSTEMSLEDIFLRLTGGKPVEYRQNSADEALEDSKEEAAQAAAQAAQPVLDAPAADKEDAEQ